MTAKERAVRGSVLGPRDQPEGLFALEKPSKKTHDARETPGFHFDVGCVGESGAVTDDAFLVTVETDQRKLPLDETPFNGE